MLDLQSLNQPSAWKAFLFPKARRIVEFLTSQGIAIAGRLLFGFVCVRLLPIPEYAKFAVVYGFLGTLSVLMDLAFSGTLFPLVGERIDDRNLIASYVASLRQLAHWVYLGVAPFAVVVYPLIVRRQHWSWQVVAAMVAVLLVASWYSRVSGTYGAVLILRRDRGYWYRAQVISNWGALALLGACWFVHSLNAFSAILINLAATIYVSLAYYLRANRLLGVTGRPTKELRHAIIHLALPNTPLGIFNALQGQISLVLITLFGRTTAVAGVGALSRLGQIFLLFGMMSPLLIEPYFARLPEDRLTRNYIGALTAVGCFCVSMTLVSAYLPQVFLWILGHKYSGLRHEVVLMIATSSLSFFSSVIWVIHSARRFVYWWNSLMVIIITVAVQALFIWKMDLSTVRAVLILSLATVAAGTSVNVLTGVYGFIFGPRRTPIELAVPIGGDIG